jgi:hypothetical protein
MIDDLNFLPLADQIGNRFKSDIAFGFGVVEFSIWITLD